MVSTRRQATLGQSPSVSQGVAAQTQDAAQLSGSTTPVASHAEGSSRIAGISRGIRANGATSAPSSQSKPHWQSIQGHGDIEPDGDGVTGTRRSQVPSALSDDKDNHPLSVDGTEVSKPPPKRRKNNKKWTAEMKLRASTTREARNSLLRSFLQLPQDVVLEMLGHLPPGTLLSIARTSKDLRATVFSIRYADIWRHSRTQLGVPEPPAGFSEPQWASLLFDSAHCQVCWDNKPSEVDWYFLKRACRTCYESHTVRFPKSYDLLKFVDIEMMEYIPGRHQVHKYHFNGPYESEVFWDDDAIALVKEWQELAQHTDGAGRSAFQAWKMQRREILRKRYSFISTCRLWHTNEMYPSKKLVKHREQRLAEENRHHYVEEIKARLVKAGYKTKDIEMCRLVLQSSAICANSPTIIDAEWAKMQERFEPDARKQRNLRLALEMEVVIGDRLLVLGEVYQEYLGTLTPLEQCHCPPLNALRTNPSVVAVLESDTRVKVTRTNFQHIVDLMQTYIDQVHLGIKRSLHVDLAQEPWLLAKNVFGRCWDNSDVHVKRAEDRILVGWDMVATHQYREQTKVWLRPGVAVEVPRAFEQNWGSSKHSELLISMADLEPMVTVKSMDERDPRFVCERCESQEHVADIKVYTWRAALSHMHDNYSHGMRLAEERESKAAKNSEGPAREQAKAWSCNHCPQYLDAECAETKQAVLEHLKTKHSIANPQMPRDYFVNERCRHAYEVPYVYKRK